MAYVSFLSQAAKVAHPVKLRSIYLRVKPAPATLSERRAVLGALKQHGEIEVFKKLQDASSFISVATNRATADTIIARSPLEFEYVNESAHAAGSHDDKSLADAGAEAGTAGEPKRTFVVEVFPAGNYGHKSTVKRSPLHGPWPGDNGPLGGESFATAALRAVVPADMAARGLRDWETGGLVEDQEAWAPAARDARYFIRLRSLRRSGRDVFKDLNQAAAAAAASASTAALRENIAASGSETASLMRGKGGLVWGAAQKVQTGRK
ncbi:hypothetical protein B0T22DRAFT_464421 [Podospora appendiculata]|uniref:Uncharacterized protein n=1 Tax=Podospora appendiculata TaxID=314037 RepID=A0AAE0X4C2_9PEZI|nr:hypothetical protein B0T22DRAFT_464421 [Podospora appendiculata]